MWNWTNEQRTILTKISHLRSAEAQKKFYLKMMLVCTIIIEFFNITTVKSSILHYVVIAFAMIVVYIHLYHNVIYEIHDNDYRELKHAIQNSKLITKCALKNKEEEVIIDLKIVKISLTRFIDRLELLIN